MASPPESSGGMPPKEVCIEEEEEIRILRIKKATSCRAGPSPEAAGRDLTQGERRGPCSPVPLRRSLDQDGTEEPPPQQTLGEGEGSNIVPQEESGMGLAERRSPSDWMRLPHHEPEEEPEARGSAPSETSSISSESTEKQEEPPVGGRTAVVSRKYTTIQKETLEITIRNDGS